MEPFDTSSYWILATLLAVCAHYHTGVVRAQEPSFTCYTSGKCYGDIVEGIERPGDCCATAGLSFRSTQDDPCTDCFREEVYCDTGQEFYLAFFNNVDVGGFSRANIRLSVGSLDNDQGSFMIETRAGTTTYNNVNFPVEMEIPLDLRLEDVNDRNNGIFVQSLDDSSLSVVALTEEIGSSETFRVISTVYLPNYEYFIVSVRTLVSPDYEPIGEGSFIIIPSEDETTIELNLTQTVNIGIADDIVQQLSGSEVITRGVPISVLLNRMQTLYLKDVEDLTGSKVTSDKPIAVLSGHECGMVPLNVSFCDQLAEQIPPTSTWGKTFLTSSIATRTEGDVFKVIASRDPRTVFSGVCQQPNGERAFQLTVTLDSAGSFSTFESPRNSSCWFTSTEPVLLVQFSTAGSHDGTVNADPFMIVVPPTEQYRNSYFISTFESEAIEGQNYINILVQAPPPNQEELYDPFGVELDGVTLNSSQYSRVNCPNGEVCGYTAVINVDGGRSYVLSHPSESARFNVIVYWLSWRTGHGYFGGMNQKPIALPRVYFQEDNVAFFKFVNDTSASITLVRDGDLSTEARVVLRTEDGSALAGVDYEPLNEVIIFDAGQTSRTVPLMLFDSTLPEDEKCFTVLLTVSPGVYLSPITRTVVTIVTNDLDLLDTVLIQLKVGPMERCTSWDFGRAARVEENIRKEVAKVLAEVCQCDFPLDHIHEGELICWETPTEVTFRSTLIGTHSHNSTQLIALLDEWLKSKPTLRVDVFRLRVDSSCPIKISSLSDPECPASTDSALPSPNSLISTCINTDHPLILRCVQSCANLLL